VHVSARTGLSVPGEIVVMQPFERTEPRIARVVGLAIVRPRSHVPVFDRPAGSDYRRTK